MYFNFALNKWLEIGCSVCAQRQDVRPSHVRGVTSHIRAVTAAPQDLLRVVIPLDHTPCPASDLAHSFSSPGRERAEKEKYGKIRERRVAFWRSEQI